MRYRQLGKSDLQVPVVSFGAGPISGLMVGDDSSVQLATIARAFDLGIDYFDTAATYGEGRSEKALGRALAELGIQDQVRIATKVRLHVDQLDDIESAVLQSFELSCQRLGVERVTLLQLHNSITKQRGDLPTSVSAKDVLGKSGVVSALERLQVDGRIGHLGFTGLGDTASLQAVITDGPFISAQIPVNILLPFSADDASAGSVDVDYLNLIQKCHDHAVGVIAIRIMAGGALVGQSPSPHTYKTKFFTLDVFQRDCERARQLMRILPKDLSCAAASIRYVTETVGASTALIGFAAPEQVDSAVAASEQGRLDDDWLEELEVLQ